MVAIYLLKATILVLRNPFSLIMLKCGMPLKKNQKAKIYTKDSMKPPRYKFYSRGSKLSNTLLTRIRVGRTSLNQHKFVIGKIDSPEFNCHVKEELPQHYFLNCFSVLP